MPLNLHVGVVPTTRNGHDDMAERHAEPFQQELIAELNTPFRPDLVLLDGVDALVDGGPATRSFRGGCGSHCEARLFREETPWHLKSISGICALP